MGGIATTDQNRITKKTMCRNEKSQRKGLFIGCLRWLLSWVPGGTRTHDIQNHNLTL